MCFNKLYSIVKLLRPNDWVKNLFIFVPLFFAGKLQIKELTFSIVDDFVAFCLAASFVYVLNDIVDEKKDKLHPVKRNRPIASGVISKKEALSLLFILLFLDSFMLFYWVAIEKYLIILYILLNVAYTFYLKNIPIVDITIISAGFVIRVLVGGIASSLFVSKWLIIMTFLLAMCLGLGKRRDELIVSNHGEIKLRPALQGYNFEFINLSFVFMTVTTVICYIMYSLSPDVEQRLGTGNIYYTSFFVILGLLRFLQIVIVEQKSGSPTAILLGDRFIQVVLLLWFLTFSILIYI